MPTCVNALLRSLEREGKRSNAAIHTESSAVGVTVVDTFIDRREENCRVVGIGRLKLNGGLALGTHAHEAPDSSDTDVGGSLLPHLGKFVTGQSLGWLAKIEILRPGALL